MGALHGLRVLELSRTAAARTLCGWLGDHGADVVTALEPTPDAVALADVVVADDGVDAPEHVIVVRMPPMAARTDLVADDGVIGAATGLFEPVVGSPRFVPWAIPSTLAAMVAATGVVAAVIERLRSGLGQEVRVAWDDAVVAALDVNALFLVDAPPRWNTVQWAATPFMRSYRCGGGGYVYVHAALRGHALRLAEVVGGVAPGLGSELRWALRDGVDPAALTLGRARRATRALADAFALEGAGLWESRLAAAGLCAARVRTPEEWRAHRHPAASGQLVDGRPGVHVVLSRTPGEPSGPREAADWAEASPWTGGGGGGDRAPLAGVKVLDLTQVIAGPVVARTLAELGADVHRLENPHLQAGFTEPFHVAFSAGKRTTWLDLASAEGRASLRAILESFRPDVVVQSFRPGDAERRGVGEADIREVVPDAVLVRVSAYGPGGPWSDRPGWEQTAQAAVGMQAVWGGAGAPDLYPVAICDFATGLSGAFAALLALAHRARTGEGQRVDASLTASAVQLMGDGEGPHGAFHRLSDGVAFVAPRRAEDLPSSIGDLSVGEAAERFPGRVVARRKLAEILRDPGYRQRGSVRLEDVDGVGRVTLTTSALKLSRTPIRDLGPARPRGGDDFGDVVSVAPSQVPARRARPWPVWALEQAVWALFLLIHR